MRECGVGWGGDDGTILGFDYDSGYMMICIYENSWHSKLNGWTLYIYIYFLLYIKNEKHPREIDIIIIFF